jgi:hypothetical protein
MIPYLEQLLRKRIYRHVLFWMFWVFGFTFIKSFGQSFDAYFGWFSYYVITLPIFMGHTYLVTYLLIPRFFTRKGMPVFILLFLGLFYGISVLELLVSHEFIFEWYPVGAEASETYLALSN